MRARTKARRISRQFQGPLDVNDQFIVLNRLFKKRHSTDLHRPPFFQGQPAHGVAYRVFVLNRRWLAAVCCLSIRSKALFLDWASVLSESAAAPTCPLTFVMTFDGRTR